MPGVIVGVPRITATGLVILWRVIMLMGPTGTVGRAGDCPMIATIAASKIATEHLYFQARLPPDLPARRRR